jgi:hypothetical protein
MGTNAVAFASTATFSNTEQKHYEAVAVDFYDDNSALLNLPTLKFESFQQDSFRPTLKVVSGSKLSDNSKATIIENNFGFQNLKCGKTVYLKLPSFSIAYPFHSFP